MAATAKQRILLTGASGFVGSRLHARLIARDLRVRCLTRNAARAVERHPTWEWMEGDVCDELALRRALKGCSAMYYLVHDMGNSDSYSAREAASARGVVSAAAAAGVQRIIYLGGVLPGHVAASEHLRSRAAVGEILRGGAVPALELRASMIIGHGSLSFLIVRDLAARLPFMLLPRWLESLTQPVAIDDVLVALERALEVPLPASCSYDLPGPEILSGREILIRTARSLGLRKPAVVRVPVLTPRLSSHWVRFVTRAPWGIAREVVVGLTSDLLARDRSYWSLIDHTRLSTFDESAGGAIDEERSEPRPSGGWSLIESLMQRFASDRQR